MFNMHVLLVQKRNGKHTQNGEIGIIYCSNKDIIIIYLQIYSQQIYSERLPEIQPVNI